MAFDELGAMRDHDHRAILALLEKLFLAALLEAVIAYSDHFIDEKAIELDDHRQSKSQASAHAIGIGLDRLVEVTPQFGKILNKGNFVFDRGIINTANETEVVHAGEGALKAPSKCKRPRNIHRSSDRAVGGVLHATEQADERGFSTAVPAKNAELFARHHPKADIIQNSPLSPVNRVALGDIGNFNHLERLLRGRGLMAEG